MKKLLLFFIFSIFFTEIASASLGLGMFGNRHTIHTLDGSETGKIFIKSARDDLKNTLEFRHYAGIISEYLAKNGFRRTKDESEAKYIAIVNYGLSDDGMYSTVYKVDVNNDIGHSFNTDIIEYALAPKRSLMKKQGYTRVLEINIYDLKENKETAHVYKGKIVSRGKCGEFQQVGPDLIKMFFKKWPGKNGTKRIISLASGIC